MEFERRRPADCVFFLSPTLSAAYERCVVAVLYAEIDGDARLTADHFCS
jgi:hypothetical protein